MCNIYLFEINELEHLTPSLSAFIDFFTTFLSFGQYIAYLKLSTLPKIIIYVHLQMVVVLFLM